MTASAHLFARPVHAQRGAVPSGPVPRRGGRGTQATPSPTAPPAGLGSGPDRHQDQDESPRPVLVALFAPAGFHRPTAARPGHLGGGAA